MLSDAEKKSTFLVWDGMSLFVEAFCLMLPLRMLILTWKITAPIQCILSVSKRIANFVEWCAVKWS
jgi:hypothetical protein